MPRRKPVWRYVEVTDGDRFHAAVVEESTANEAERAAIQSAAEAWGMDPDKIHEFIQRVLTDEKAAELIASIKAGTFDPDWWVPEK